MKPEECRKCGHLLTAGTKFCPACGKRRSSLSGLAFICVAFLLIPLVAALTSHSTVAEKQPASPTPTPNQFVLDRIGDVVTARSNYVCASSEQALEEIVGWIARGDRTEAVRVMIRTRSDVWQLGQQAKILDAGGFLSGLGVHGRLVRILATDRECYAQAEAFR
jgi:hypothetical protein